MSIHFYIYIGRPYPHNYGNSEGIQLPDCQGAAPPFREFPILPGGTNFRTQLEPGADRIIYKANGDDYQYCGVITHTNAPGGGNNFTLCPDLQS